MPDDKRFQKEKWKQQLAVIKINEKLRVASKCGHVIMHLRNLETTQKSTPHHF
jgi:hypothetical protein